MKSKILILSIFSLIGYSLFGQITDTINHINNECNDSKEWTNSINVNFDNDSLIVYGTVVMNCMLENGLIREIKDDSIFLIAYDTCGANCWCDFDYQTFVPDLGYDSYYISLGYQGFPNCDYSFYMDTTIYRGIQNIIENQNSHITLFPNPFTSYIDISSKFKLDEFYIYSLNGKLLYSNTTQQKSISTKINLVNLKKGVYIIQFKSGNQDIYQKIIKQ